MLGPPRPLKDPWPLRVPRRASRASPPRPRPHTRTPASARLLLLRQVKLGSSLGGPYLGVHLRRKDFIWGHREDVPSLEGAVRKVRRLLEQLGLRTVFVATDAAPAGRPLGRRRAGTGRRALGVAPPLCGGRAPPARRPVQRLRLGQRPSFAEVELLRRLLPEMVRFAPTRGELERYKDGGVAIIDQWVCAHARCPVPEGAHGSLPLSPLRSPGLVTRADGSPSLQASPQGPIFLPG